MTSRLKTLIWAVTLVVGLNETLSAAESPPSSANDRLLQQESKQQQIKTTTQRVADQLATIIDEFDRNAISGQDVAVLKAIRGVLGSLSEKDMQLVVEFLQKARQASDATASTKEATEAYVRQKAIILQLKQLITEYQRQQMLYELSLRFKEFASRQTAYMWSGVRLAKKTEGKSYTAFDEGQKTELKVQQTDEETLKDEVDPLLRKLDQLTKEITDGPAAERAKIALGQARQGGLMPALTSAADELKEDKLKLLSAVGNEKKARDQFREIARLLILSHGEIEALRQALHELDKTIEDQKQLAKDTSKIEKDDSKIEPRQAELVDATDLIRHDVESLAPVAADQLNSAMDKMQEARSVLNSEKDYKQQRAKAPPKQEDALGNLEQARRDLLEQLARAEQQSVRPENLLAGLKELQEQVRQLAQQEEQLKQETAAAQKKDLPSKAPKQGDLKDTAQELQQKSASQSPSAADSIAEAASQMQKAQNSLAKSENNSAAQQAAIDALQKADQQLGQEIAKLEEALKELAALEDALTKLEKIIEDQQRIQFATAKEALKPKLDPLQALAAEQDQLGAHTAQLQQEVTKPAPIAANYLGEAKQHMAQAKTDLDKPAPEAAQSDQAKALAALYAAKRELEKKIADLQEMLGLSPDTSEALADALSLIEQALQQVNEATGELQQAPAGLLEALIQQQQQIATGLAQRASSSQALSQAHKAADEAVRQLQQTDLRSSITEMKAARAGMQQSLQSAPAPQNQSDGAPSLGELSQQQKQVQRATEALLSALESAPAAALQKAAQLLEGANTTIGPLAAGKFGPLPSAAQSALESAQGSLTSGSAQASAGQGPPAHASSASAAQALEQAQAALAMAQAGLSSGPSMAGAKPGQSKIPGQGQQPGQTPGRGTPSPQGTGRQGNWDGPGGADGPRRNTLGPGQFTGLPKRDRAAIQQSQAEKYPQEYGPLVEQYLKNLSDQAGQR